MGYTHHWHRPPVIPDHIFDRIRADFESWCFPWRMWAFPSRAGMAGMRAGLPTKIFDSTVFAIADTQKMKRSFVPYPAEGARGIGPSHTAIGDCDEFLRLKHRCCGGSCRHETFGFPRMAEPHWPISNEPGTEGMVFNWTKTGFKPFDIAVTAALLIAKRYYEMTCSSRVMAPGYAIGRMQKNCASGISGMEPGLERWKIHRSNSGQSRTEHKVSET